MSNIYQYHQQPQNSKGSHNQPFLIEEEDDDDDEDMGLDSSTTTFPYVYNNNSTMLEKPSRPVLVRYEVANNIFEVTERYELKYAIGQGAYGIVCSAFDQLSKERVAIKKIFNIFGHDQEFQKRILREIKILKHFDHENVHLRPEEELTNVKKIICLTDLIPPRNEKEFKDVYIVTDLMETDLRQIVKSDQALTDQHIQYFIYQILRALRYIHSANVLHRDLKPGNILLNSNCELKICDFGLSRGIDFETANPMMSTPYVATRWYRAPELLLMWETATKAIDIWSVGCIFAELLGRKVLFPGANYLNQLDLIIDVLGSPKPHQIKGCEKAIAYVKQLPKKAKRPFSELFPMANPQALDLLERMLTFDPTQRITVEDALSHPYLKVFHEEEDEPTAPIFDFKFEEKAKSGDLREMIYKEIMEWNLVNNNTQGDAVLIKK